MAFKGLAIPVLTLDLRLFAFRGSWRGRGMGHVLGQQALDFIPLSDVMVQARRVIAVSTRAFLQNSEH